MAEEMSLKEIIKEEYKRCLLDPVHFMKKYCKIQHPKKGKIPFQLYPFQEKTLRALRDHDYNIVLKSRQLGISTLTAGYALWLMTFFSDKNILVIATKQEVAKNLVLKVSVMYNNLPSWLKLKTVEENKLSVRFTNGSQIKAVSSSGDAGRSEALSLLVIDEAAFVQNVEPIWISAQQTLATGGQAIILSTPNGTGNFFHQTWVDAETNPLSRFHPIKLKWDVHPEHDQAWRDKQEELLGHKAAAQECLDGDAIVSVREISDIFGNAQKIKIKDLYQTNTRKYELLTPSGWQKFDEIVKNVKNRYVHFLVGSNNNEIKCSLNHKFYINGKETLAENLKCGDELDGDGNDKYIINDIKIIDSEIELYDIINVRNGNLFIVYGITTHNCDADFVTSGNTVIDGTLLQWYENTTMEEPIKKDGPDGNLWVWEEPDLLSGKNYMIVADVARGDGADYSAFHILDIDNVVQVAEYRGQLSTKEYGNYLVNIATQYNDALLVIENANIGWAVLQTVIDRGYKNLYYSPKEGSVSDVNTQLAKYIDLKNTTQMIPGFTTSSRTRPLVIEKLDTYTRERIPIIKSKRLIDELKVFIWNGNKAEAMNGYNDDLVLSFSIALWMRDTALKLRIQGMEMTRKTLDYYGKVEAPVYTNNSAARRQYGWSMKTGRGDADEDLTWLLGK